MAKQFASQTWQAPQSSLRVLSPCFASPIALTTPRMGSQKRRNSKKRREKPKSKVFAVFFCHLLLRWESKKETDQSLKASKTHIALLTDNISALKILREYIHGIFEIKINHNNSLAMATWGNWPIAN